MAQTQQQNTLSFFFNGTRLRCANVKVKTEKVRKQKRGKPKRKGKLSGELIL